MALEDIYQEGIRFYVYPGTHNFIPQAKYNEGDSKRNQSIHQDFLKEINTILESKNFEMYAPPLKKGDIFFWGSRIIHGSIDGTNPNLRRRSIAAHFVPDGFRFGNLEKDFHPSFKQKYGLTYANYWDFS